MAKKNQNVEKNDAKNVKLPKADKKKNSAKVSLKKENTKSKKTPQKEKKEKKSSPINIKYLGGLLFKKMASGGAKQLSSNADEVNKLNVFPVPDGDTGDNMRMTIESGITEIENIETDDLAEVMKSLSHGMLLGARGNSGVILSQFFAGISKGLETSEKADPKTFGKALELGVKQAYSSVMTPTEGTILTVAREAVEYAVSRVNESSTIRSLFADLTREMHKSLDRTPEILSVLKEAGVVDSGAAGLVYIMDGFNCVLNGKEVKDESTRQDAPKAAPVKYSFGPDSVMTYGYCTELLVQLQNAKCDPEAFDVEPLKAFLGSLGDSIVCFKTDTIVKIHVHTLTPDRVLAHCREFGEFLTVKIENMSVQHTELSEAEPKGETTPEGKPEEKTEQAIAKKKYGAVVVCNGEGLENLFTELGCDVIVNGGQTHNPSTQDFLEAFEKINAENIFIFPNNSNIFMAANQAAELYTEAKIHVIPSKNIGTGYVALSSLNFDDPDVDAVKAEMEEAMARVNAGYISPSIRDADISGVHINNGDTIGIIDKEIVLSESERAEAAHRLASMLLDMPGKFMLTVFSGADATDEQTAELDAFLKEKYPSAEIYFIAGGQEIYPFIFVAE